ncbi:calcium/sodium antiporter [Patescibacteria group bacterium]|nr:calcium/sodium antiporter [Patescibacteria group bacterium]
MLITLALLAVGLIILVFGADWLVKGASSIASKFGISPLVIGLTVVAFGTSMPELTVSVYAALTGASEISVGNVLGSNIANILLILGISAAIVPLAVSSSTVKWEIPLALLAMIFLFVFGADRILDGGALDVITRTDGIALLGFFIIFMFYIFALVRQEGDTSKTEGEAMDEASLPTLKVIAYVVVGLAALIFGGKLLVDNAVIIASLFGLSETVIGLTIVAVGTSLPELATSVIAALRKEADIAIGNIVGSNIFNVFWILGVSAVIAPLPSPNGFLIDASVGIAATLALLLVLFVGKKHHIDRWQGILFILAYVIYVIYLVMRG